MKQLSQRLRNEFQDKEYAHAFVDSFLNASIATQIKVLREERGWTQKKLADKTGMEQSRISLLENVNYNKWSISTLLKLKDAFDVTLTVSFDTFSEKIEDIVKFSRENLETKSREYDLALEDKEAQIDQIPINVLRIADYDGIRVENNEAISSGSRPSSHLFTKYYDEVALDEELALIG
ncbi:MAG: helix-turn-helix domain-containing protein [Thermodesulfobacteriota bacterium]